MRELVARWRAMKAEFEQQLAAFGPPMNLHSNTNNLDTTADSKARVTRCIAELEALLKTHGGQGV
jgi:hypothetical protein